MVYPQKPVYMAFEEVSFLFFSPMTWRRLDGVNVWLPQRRKTVWENWCVLLSLSPVLPPTEMSPCDPVCSTWILSAQLQLIRKCHIPTQAEPSKSSCRECGIMTISADPLKDMHMEGFGGEHLHVQGEASNKVTEKKQSNREKSLWPHREGEWLRYSVRGADLNPDGFPVSSCVLFWDQNYVYCISLHVLVGLANSSNR